MATILIVDDLAANRRVLISLLEPHGYSILEAVNGAEGLAVMRAERPDLVITDVLMPVMDGYEFVRQIQLDENIANTPVVFYTAHYVAGEARALARSGGVADVLIKPIETDLVLQTVRRILSGSTPFSTVNPAPAKKYDRDHLRLLTNKLSEKVDDIKATNARLKALINIGLELASERDPDKLLKSVCMAARELFAATYVTLGTVDLDDRTVQHFVSCGSEPGEWFKPGDPIAGFLHEVVTEPRAWRGDNPGGDPVTLELPAQHPPVHTFLATPLASPSQVYGWFCLVDNEGRPFTDEDEDLVTALTGQVGRIYENGHFRAVAVRRAADLEKEIVERKQAEDELRIERDRVRVTEERARFALLNANVGIWDMDYTTGVVAWSATLEAHYGLEPGTFGGTWEAFVERIHPDDRQHVFETVARAASTGSDFFVRNRTVWPDGTIRWLEGSGRIQIDDAGKPLRGVGISIDVTERHTLEEQYRQAQKMEAIGRLAGGVAHDFNNLLTTILGNRDLILKDMHDESVSRKDVGEIRTAAMSAAQLTSQLLAFSRKEIIQPTLLDLNELVSEVRTMLGRILGEDLKVVLGVGPHLALIKADRGQVQQILLNLAVNARDAMVGGGTLRIETANVQLDEEYARTHSSIEPGNYVLLTVSDTGTGMTPEVQARLFEPFFTTKEPGKGTGLGLATVYGIVTRAGGTVSVYSEIGEGTAIKVYFPQAHGAKAEDPTPAPALRNATETILLVEDAEGLRKITRRMLERQGYHVLVAANLDDALIEFETNSGIDLLLTDVVMPGGSGPDLGNRLTELRPDLKVVYMSGYTEEAIVHHGVLNEGIWFLQKPFTAEALGRKIGAALDTWTTLASSPHRV